MAVEEWVKENWHKLAEERGWDNETLVNHVGQTDSALAAELRSAVAPEPTAAPVDRKSDGPSETA